MILVIGPRLEGYSVNFLVMQTHLSCRILLAVDFLGLRRSGSSSKSIDPPQDFPKQVPGHGDFGQLERDVPPVTDDLGTDLHQLFPQRAQRPINVGYWLIADISKDRELGPLYPRKRTFKLRNPDSDLWMSA